MNLIFKPFDSHSCFYAWTLWVQITFLLRDLISIRILNKKRGERLGLTFTSKNESIISLKMEMYCRECEHIPQLSVCSKKKGNG